jgi:hypothetical protein
VAQQRRRSNEPIPTFSKDVAPIFYKSCTGCHRPGRNCADVAFEHTRTPAWAKSIRDKVANREMPPWHADPKHGEWRNDRRITQEAINTILAWVNNGAQEGDPKGSATDAGVHHLVGASVNLMRRFSVPNNPCQRRELLLINI